MTKYRIKDSKFDSAVLNFKKKYLIKLLKKNKFNILKTSRDTELSRSTIYKIIGFSKRHILYMHKISEESRNE